MPVDPGQVFLHAYSDVKHDNGDSLKLLTLSEAGCLSLSLLLPSYERKVSFPVHLLRQDIDLLIKFNDRCVCLSSIDSG